MDNLIARFFPATPCIGFLCYPGLFLCRFYPFCINYFRLCGKPCPVQRLSEGQPFLAEQLPRPDHDLSEIVLHFLRLPFLAEKPPRSSGFFNLITFGDNFLAFGPVAHSVRIKRTVFYHTVPDFCFLTATAVQAFLTDCFNRCYFCHVLSFLRKRLVVLCLHPAEPLQLFCDALYLFCYLRFALSYGLIIYLFTPIVYWHNYYIYTNIFSSIVYLHQ